MVDNQMQERTQYLSFVLDSELYALDIAKVREVLEFQRVTRIPNAPAFMSGVINLRGHAVPVVDLRLKFDMEATVRTVDTCVIIVVVVMDGEEVVLGALADSVREVVELTDDEVKSAPKLGTGINAEFIQGMARQDDRFMMILEIDRVFSASELAIVQAKGGMSGDDPEA
ncbi:chemotaxis protein CheW [Desulfovibrio ferrophilus]|uniref:CheW protein n=1 Tax=Desulfovibrio ferrophilus TaxID=241368 RepID=A0A2Z6AUI5_9BACT|nr:chemotaxis protein CheW [Desulfovibrio ferrophilus]BBD06894.1 CheW protein [Desulfovibrio ferrophilus]